MPASYRGVPTSAAIWTAVCEVLTLYYFQELKLTEISDTLQIGLPLVKYRLRKAKIQLEEVLRKEEYDEFGRKNENV